ncbi:hypothetical protein DYBT9275_01562 [Dyadobacter sp. CECT 9275]|uniref:Esterase n=1 Tax=Dyadobacter helix TaxID=2822344 RepID=A0A916JA15_9BACT|nr:alpha/beta fold hydrolase [Dyadobacter sp. CECT 9275]CAG4995148.1 hypothetical protein DYBT9275_01562 [Dyadobacter sp. CECT 9275]
MLKKIKPKYGVCFATFLLVFPVFIYAQNIPYQDLTHNSKVFGHQKWYRLYLPAGYENSDKHYPVIYFFHGWGGRYFKDDNARLEYEKLKTLVDKYQCIMVMWDGNLEEKQPRPYNVGDHADIRFEVQMKDYFSELVRYVDTTYRTLTDRGHRAIIGFSMGGFMSLYLAGKYPHLINSIVSMMGSPEFFVGTPANHTLYPVRYTFENLQEVKTRVHTSPTDILYYLNEEVRRGAAWQGKTVEFEEFPGGHMVDLPGQTSVFEKAMKFASDSFQTDHKKPAKWSHYDLYGDFEVWGYELRSSKTQPGFIYLKDVEQGGFGLYTKKWLPRGPVMEMDKITLKTAPLYTPDFLYNTVLFSQKTGKVTPGKVKSDSNGTLSFELDAAGNEIGIFTENSPVSWKVADYTIGSGSKYLTADSTNQLYLKLFNRGATPPERDDINVIVESLENDVVIGSTWVSAKPDSGVRVFVLPPCRISSFRKPVLHGEPADVRLRITIKNGSSEKVEILRIPFYYDVPYFRNLKIDDGAEVRGEALGKGNGDGKVNRGEKILVYEGKNRLRIYSENPFVQNFKEEFTDEIIPARWPDGFTQSSVISISPDCPDGQEIECLASYETKTFNPIERKLTWGRVKLKVYKK